MKDAEFLNWIADRLVHVHGESENVDFVHRLRRMANEDCRTRYMGVRHCVCYHQGAGTCCDCGARKEE